MERNTTLLETLKAKEGVMEGIKERIEDAKGGMEWADGHVSFYENKITNEKMKNIYVKHLWEFTAKYWYWMDMEKLINRRK